MVLLAVLIDDRVAGLRPRPHRQPVATATDLDAWTAAKAMGIGVNIGNTLENTADLGDRLGESAHHQGVRPEPGQRSASRSSACRWPGTPTPHDGRIEPRQDEARRARSSTGSPAPGCSASSTSTGTAAGSIPTTRRRFAKTYDTFSAEAEKKYQSLLEPDRDLSSRTGTRSLIFEALNEEIELRQRRAQRSKAYATLAHVNQIFIDTVRASGRQQRQALADHRRLQHRLREDHQRQIRPARRTQSRTSCLLSVHYYTPWPFAGMTHDESWGKMRPTWGTPGRHGRTRPQVRQDGGVLEAKRHPRVRRRICAGLRKGSAVACQVDAWPSADAALSRNMVPVLWETGQDISRTPPYAPSRELNVVLRKLRHPLKPSKLVAAAAAMLSGNGDDKLSFLPPAPARRARLHPPGDRRRGARCAGGEGDRHRLHRLRRDRAEPPRRQSRLDHDAAAAAAGGAQADRADGRRDDQGRRPERQGREPQAARARSRSTRTSRRSAASSSGS